jgi:hypothetical protein
MKNSYKILIGKPEGKRPRRRPRHRWENTVRMNLAEIKWKGVEWMNMVQERDQ